ncbi:tRNA lysidine(34) synthetase TilS [Thalassotalea sp. Y01]|uniref:tRNA lysidine(34) synthetase TilS n=1 Tax=Thalassotalea sp. Y01 TaxID=2729613 RepID=UPI00145F946E|nr:tRNA lysidine(34) synthetase TilS [Thalassotalea sp. Y01]NMP16795.1 tRNA lysidine(34) synthetase TilS [Thalassotalea sp. Y01]
MNTSNSLCQQLLEFLNQHHLLGRPLTLAYSGGCDSQVLLHLLASLKIQNQLTTQLQAIHVHHGLSENADDWLRFTKQQAQRLGIPYQAINVDLQAQKRQSLEALARDARYQALSEHSADDAVIITAHHQDDQLETMLMALKRGSGVSGLAAMSDIRAHNKQQLLARPLLSSSRMDIEHYAEQHNLDWVEDESNVDERFDRNFLRRRIIPSLLERWPHMLSSSSRSAKHFSEAQQLLEHYAKDDINTISNTDKQLLIEPLKALSAARQRNVIRFYCKQHGVLMPSEAQLEQIIHTCVYAKVDANPQVKLANAMVRRYKQQLLITPIYQDLSNWVQTIDINDLPQQVSLPDDMGVLQLDMVNNQHDLELKGSQQLLPISNDCRQLILDFNYQNVKVWPDFRDKRRELKKVYQELALPNWQRGRQINVRIEQTLAAVVDRFINKDYLQSLAKTSDKHQKLLRIRRCD